MGRLRVIAGGGVDAGGVGDGKPEKASASHFIEEMGRPGHARLINLISAKQLAPLSAGDAVELTLDGTLLVASVGRSRSARSSPGSDRAWPS